MQRKESPPQLTRVTTSKAKTWWAFQPLRKPKVSGNDEKDPIDAFVKAKLATAGAASGGRGAA